MSDGILQAIEAEIDKRLMPPGMEWPRFDYGKQITWNDAPEDITAVCLALDGSCYSLHYDMPEDERMCIYEASERVKRPDTQERIDEDALMDAGKYVAGHPEAARLREYPTSFSAKQAMMSDLLRRQREFDARTMGGE